jgi:hypothetical protein
MISFYYCYLCYPPKIKKLLTYLFTFSLTPKRSKKEFEDTKGIIRSRISKKDIQYNDLKKKVKKTNNDLQNITEKSKD